MYSKRFYKTMELLVKISKLFGATEIQFYKSSQQFSVSKKRNVLKHVKMNYLLLFFWLFTSLLIVHNSYRGKDVNRFYVGLVFWVAFVCMGNFSVCVWFPGDFCRANNGSINYIKYFQGN